MKSVIIEQCEILTSLGNLDETVSDLIDGVSGIIPGPCFDIPVACAPFPDIRFRNLSHTVEWLKPSVTFSSIDLSETVFIFAAAKGDISAIEERITLNKTEARIIPLLDKQARTVCEILQIKPAAVTTISNACASGAVACEVASELLMAGRYAQAILFGFDCISRFTTAGFNSLSALSATGAAPFDAHRSGLTLGEGAALTLLTFRNAYEGDIVVAGTGTSNDANHRTGPSRTGEGLFKAAEAALVNAGMEPEQIGAVKCHGTATPYNDAMEAKALHLLFGDTCPPCVSLKGALGHLSGAGSLVEICIVAECLKRRVLPPTKGYNTHGVDEPIPVSAKTQRIDIPSALCLSAGFGGLNATVIIQEKL